jgi:signal transduction histidine kinase
VTFTSQRRTPPSWWRRRAGVRARMALIATVTVGLTLAAGSLLFVVALQRNLGTTLDGALQQQAQALADTVHAEGVSGLNLRRRVGESNVIQVLAMDGTVLTASTGLEGEAALTRARPGPGGHQATTRSRLPVGADEPYRIVALGLTGPSGQPMIVVVAQSMESVTVGTSTVAKLLLIAAPLLLVLVAAITYWLSGRALRPVEAMRRQVTDIDSRNLAARLPLPAAHDEVWRLGRTLNHMLDRLESAASAQRRFISDASHELKSPLAAIQATVEVAETYPETADWRQTNTDVLGESRRLERLVTDLLLLARADEHGLQLRREAVDLDDILKSEAARLRSTTSLTVTTRVVPVQMLGDRDQLQRAVRNLVDNASRHANSTVLIQLTVGSGMAQVDVLDDGPGIAVEDRERVFDRFVRLDDSRTRAVGGTGLGLAIVRQIAQAHGGVIAFVDAPVGALARLCLPLQADLT